jgi:hypothetical protein
MAKGMESSDEANQEVRQATESVGKHPYSGMCLLWCLAQPEKVRRDLRRCRSVLLNLMPKERLEGRTQARVLGQGGINKKY